MKPLRRLLFAALWLLLCGSAWAGSQCTPLNLDAYGGLAAESCPSGAASHFYTQKIGSRWWLCDPAGHPYFMKGVAFVASSAGNNSELLNLIQPPTLCTGSGSPVSCCTGSGTGPTCGNKYAGTSPYINYSNLSNAAYEYGYNWQIEQAHRLLFWGFNAMADETPGNLSPMWTDNAWNTSDETIPIHMPFGFESSTSAPTFGNSCDLASAVKDMVNSEGPLLSANGYSYGDYFDPHYITCMQTYLSPTGPDQTYGLGKLSTGPNQDYWLYITIDEGGQTGFLDQGPVGTGATFDWILGEIPQTTEGGNYHAGLLALCSAPTQSGTNGSSARNWLNGGSYADQEVYSKVKLADEMLSEYSGIANSSIDPSCTGGTLPSYCMGDTYPGATAMATAKTALNTAWASYYTTLSTTDSNCSSNVAECLIGNGACTGSGAPYSWCTGSGTGSATEYASWGTGTGLLDENGLCPAKGGHACWMATDPYLLTGETAAMQADQSAYYTSYLDQYFGVLTGVYRADYPGILLQMLIGGYGSPARKEALQEAGKYVDLPQTEVPWPCPTCTDMQARIDFQAQYLGDHPWIEWVGWPTANNADSSESGQSDSGLGIGANQGARGSTYQSWLASAVAAKSTVYNDYPVVGFYWWGLYDQDNEHLNWGLASRNDNPYDGKAAIIAPGTDQWGYSTGGEAANYGDFIDPVMTANGAVYQVIR